jgi:gliding motility-associated-like protein
VNSTLDGGINSTTVGCTPNHGTTAPDASGCIVYTPTKDYVGYDTLCVVVCNGSGLCDTTVFVVTVTPVKDTIRDTTPQDTPITLCVNSTLDGGINSTTVGCTPNHGTTAPDASGCIVYTPTKDYVGNDTLCVVVCNGAGLCDTTVFIVTVTPVKDTIRDTTPQDTPITLCVNSILDGGINSTTVGCTPSHGTTAPDASGCIVYTPATDYIGNDTLCVVVCNGAGLCDTTVFVVTVTPVTDTIRVSDTIKTTTSICNFLPADTTGITVTSCDDATSGTSGHSGIWSIDPNTKCLVYTAGPVKTLDTLCVKVCDIETKLCRETIVIITVTGLPPVAVNDTTKTDPNVPVTIPVLNNDNTPDQDPLTLCADEPIITAPGHGTVVVNGDGTITYTPVTGYTGIDSFQYEVCDSEGSSSAWVFITVNGCIYPNAFSPNGDGINDVFEVPCSEGDLYFSVWNRWGIEVYRNDKYVNDWDGTYKGSPLPDGTYYYVLKYTKSSGEEVNKAGFITLHR